MARQVSKFGLCRSRNGLANLDLPAFCDDCRNNRYGKPELQQFPWQAILSSEIRLRIMDQLAPVMVGSQVPADELLARLAAELDSETAPELVLEDRTDAK